MVHIFPMLLLCGIIWYFYGYYGLIRDEARFLRREREAQWRGFVRGARPEAEAEEILPQDAQGIDLDEACGDGTDAAEGDGEAEPQRPGFSLLDRFTFPKAFPLEKKDALPIAVITLVYAVIAFLNLGIFTNPQTFWRLEGVSKTATIDLGENTDISRLMYYTGIWEGEYTFETSEDGFTFTQRSNLAQPHSDVFKWLYSKDKDMKNVRYLRISAEKGPLELGEIAVLKGTEGNEELMDASGFSSDNAAAENLFDEQDTVPDSPNYLNSAYFDEIYHARTAYEHKIGVYPYETTHPPLGKLIIMIGINLFGLVPFGWRFMGTLFGVLMLPIIYCMLKNVFGKTTVAVCGAILLASDFMHFTQTRIATIDTYSVFFIILMYFFMYRYIAKGPDATFKEGAPDLFLCGLSFGVGAACKWTSIYAGAGLLILFCMSVYIRAHRARDAKTIDAAAGRAFSAYLLKTLGLCLAAFIIIPGIIYVLSYLPYTQASDRTPIEIGLESREAELSKSGGADGARPIESSGDQWLRGIKAHLETVLENQEGMFSYHSGIVDTHPYESRWYQWIFDIRPILYYAQSDHGLYSSFGAFGNPLLYWAGLVAMAFMGVWSRLRRDGRALFILIAYLSQLVPWMLIPRLTFAYHYFPSSVFLIFALCFVQGQISRRETGKKWLAYAPAAIAVLLFIWFYPALSGLATPSFYVKNFINWLPSWPFFS